MYYSNNSLPVDDVTLSIAELVYRSFKYFVSAHTFIRTKYIRISRITNLTFLLLRVFYRFRVLSIFNRTLRDVRLYIRRRYAYVYFQAINVIYPTRR